MTIDARIPLMGRPPNIMSQGDVLELQNSHARNSLLNLQLQDDSGMRNALAQPGALDDQGMPSGAMLSQLAQSGNLKGYGAAADMQTRSREQAALVEQRKAAAEAERRRAMAQYGGEVTRGQQTAMLMYQRLKDQGLSESLAREGAQRTWAKQLDDWSSNGAIGEHAKSAPKTFDPDLFHSMSTNYDNFEKSQMQQAQFAQQSAMQDKRDAAADARLARREAAADARIDRRLALTGEGGGKPPVGYRWSKERDGELEPIPGGPATALSASAIKDMAQNEVTLTKIDRALELAEKYPDSFGMKNYGPDWAVQRLTSQDEVDTRSMVADIGGQRLHDRTGASQTVQEMARTKPYIPQTTDTPDTVKTKLRNLQREYRQMQQELAQGKSLANVIDRRRGDSPVPSSGGGWKIEVVK